MAGVVCSRTGLAGCAAAADCTLLLCGGGLEADKAVCASDGCCTCKDRAWFFFVFGAYMMLLVGVACVARATAPSRRVAGGDAASASATAGPRTLREHFMATGHFGTAVLTLTLFSTAFSGYTVVGVPQEASEMGWVALRWAAIGVPINLSALVFFPRLRRIGVARGYCSPTDIISDRFNATPLRFVSALTLLITLFVFTAGQVKAIINILDALSLGRLDKTATTVMIMAVVVVCEWIGGQRSVAISDAIQAGIMLCAFVVMPFVVLHLYGSLDDVVGAGCSRAPHCVGGPERTPWVVRAPTATGSCPADAYEHQAVAPGAHRGGSNASAPTAGWEWVPSPAAFADRNCWSSTLANNGSAFAGSVTPAEQATALFVDHASRTRFGATALTMLSFLWNMVPFPLNTHILQKIYVAKSDEILKRSCMLMCWASLVCNLPSIYYGLVYAARFKGGEGGGGSGGSAFPTLAGALVDEGGFAKLVSIIAACSVLAAIMSSVDSLLIGANNLITVDLVQTTLWPAATPKALLRISLVATPAFAFAALLFALHAESVNFAALINLQSSFLWQVAPTFVACCYSDRLAAYPLLCGQAAGTLATIVLEVRGAGTHAIAPSGLWGLLLNLAVACVAQLVLATIGSAFATHGGTIGSRPAPPHGSAPGGPGPGTGTGIRPGECLSWQGARRLDLDTVESEIMGNTAEPLAGTRGKAVAACSAVLVSLGLPWWDTPFAEQAVFLGMPKWGVVFLSCYLVSLVLVTYLYWGWGTDTACGVGVGVGVLARGRSGEGALKLHPDDLPGSGLSDPLMGMDTFADHSDHSGHGGHGGHGGADDGGSRGVDC